MTHAERLDQYISEGRLIRHAWTGTDAQGRQTACLLAALFPETGVAQDAAACPAAAMPPWLAHLTPWIDDSGSDEAWPVQVRRFADVMHRLPSAKPEALEQAQWKVRAIAVREAMRHTGDAAVLSACERVLRWLESPDHDETERRAAAAAAAAAAEVAWRAAAEVAWRAAAEVAWRVAAAAEAEAAEVAAAAAEVAWRAAAEVAWRVAAAAEAEAEAAEVAAAAAEVAAAWAAADRMIDAILTVLEAAVSQ